MSIVETHSFVKLFTVAANFKTETIAQQSVGDQELSLELTESPITQQFVCDRELFSELIEPPIVQQTVSERELF